MSKIVLTLANVPAALRDGIKSCLEARGIRLGDDVLHELGNNVAQSLCDVDEGLDVDPTVIELAKEVLEANPPGTYDAIGPRSNSVDFAGALLRLVGER